MNLVEIFDQVAVKMRSDFEMARRAIDNHAGLKGNSFEETFRTFLRNYLPKSLDISTGIIVDSDGNQSKQLDVIISDAAKTPIFFQSGDIRVIPVETVYAAIEVKAHLDKSSLDSIYSNMISVRKLIKKAFVIQKGPISYYSELYGKEWEIWPICYFVFAYESGDLVEIAAEINQRNIKDQNPAWERIDSICVLDKGVICNQDTKGEIDALPTATTKLILAGPQKMSLLLFYTLISRYLNQVRLPDFRILDYLGNTTFQILS